MCILICLSLIVSYKNCCNYCLSSALSFIKKTFEILVMHGGIYWRPMQVSVAKVSRIVMVCSKLHNFIIDSTGFISVLSFSDAN